MFRGALTGHLRFGERAVFALESVAFYAKQACLAQLWRGRADSQLSCGEEQRACFAHLLLFTQVAIKLRCRPHDLQPTLRGHSAAPAVVSRAAATAAVDTSAVAAAAATGVNPAARIRSVVLVQLDPSVPVRQRAAKNAVQAKQRRRGEPCTARAALRRMRD
eukprot:866225-Pleurochrysis_carterae.AAC.1